MVEALFLRCGFVTVSLAMIDSRVVGAIDVIIENSLFEIYLFDSLLSALSPHVVYHLARYLDLLVIRKPDQNLFDQPVFL